MQIKTGLITNKLPELKHRRGWGETPPTDETGTSVDTVHCEKKTTDSLHPRQKLNWPVAGTVPKGQRSVPVPVPSHKSRQAIE